MGGSGDDEGQNVGVSVGGKICSVPWSPGGKTINFQVASATTSTCEKKIRVNRVGL